LRPDLAAVAVNDPLNRGKSDAGAWELGGGVKTLECPEKLVHI